MLGCVKRGFSETRFLRTPTLPLAYLHHYTFKISSPSQEFEHTSAANLARTKANFRQISSQLGLGRVKFAIT